MTRKNPSLIRTLLLLVLVVGPLQAQSVFACPMMDEVMRGDCCCVGHESNQDCPNATCEKAVNANPEPCCERSVEVSIDADARQEALIVTAVEVRSDVDPPPAIATSLDGLFSPQSTVAICLEYHRSTLRHSGSDTYLLTQRLRI